MYLKTLQVLRCKQWSDMARAERQENIAEGIANAHAMPCRGGIFGVEDQAKTFVKQKRWRLKRRKERGWKLIYRKRLQQ